MAKAKDYHPEKKPGSYGREKFCFHYLISGLSDCLLY
jgi:hypothetical protein